MPQLITSIHNPRVKQAARLRERKGREEQGRIIIDGGREIERAIQGSVQLEELYVCQELCVGEDTHRAIVAAEQTKALRLDVSATVFGKLAYGERAEGIVAVARTPARRFNDLSLPANPLVGVLVGVEKPGNIGAVMRSADGAGLAALIIADGGTDLYNPNVIRASLGVVFSLPISSASSSETLCWLRERGLQLVAARVDAEMDSTAVDFRRGTAIILGSEAEGLPDAWQASDITAARLPMLGTADSLNVSCTAAVLFYEALRQRAKL
jgi:TrmH family RNA methyltransferase